MLPVQYGGDAALISIQDAVAARRAAEAHGDADDDSQGSSDGASDSVSELGDGRLTAAKRALGSVAVPIRAVPEATPGAALGQDAYGQQVKLEDCCIQRITGPQFHVQHGVRVKLPRSLALPNL